ncbi:MAG: polymorphic toxin type 46 domain-containing protein, partial [Acidimicrobiales bacterium]
VNQTDPSGLKVKRPTVRLPSGSYAGWSSQSVDDVSRAFNLPLNATGRDANTPSSWRQSQDPFIDAALDFYGVNASGAILNGKSGIGGGVPLDPNEPIWRVFGDATEQVLLGNFTDKVTVTGTTAQVGLGFTGLDLLADIRDIASDVANFKFTTGHLLQTALDVAATLPILGTLKYADEVGTLLKAGDRARTGSRVVQDIAPRTGEALAARRAYLNQKFGRSGNLDVDINVRGYLEQVESLNVATGKNSAVFYSGPGNRALAESFTSGTGRATLEITPGGRWLDQQTLFKRLPGDQALKPWLRLSERYAEEASGAVNAYVRGARPGNVFNTVEFPTLRKNPNVQRITFRGY